MKVGEGARDCNRDRDITYLQQPGKEVYLYQRATCYCKMIDKECGSIKDWLVYMYIQVIKIGKLVN